jgi:photosystem II stability/assembly factor-like uncharacterized protein
MIQSKKRVSSRILYLSCLAFALGINSYTAPASSGYEQKAVVDDSPPANLIAIKAIDQSSAWVAGRVGLFKTPDGGKNWSRVGPAIALQPEARPSAFALGNLTPVFWIDFVSEEVGWAGRYDGLIKTTDGGQTWGVVDSPMRFYQFSFYDPNNGWAFARDLFIHRSSDGGKSWTRQVKGGPVTAVSPNECWALGNKNEVIHTNDAGVNWLISRINTPERLSGNPVVRGNKVWVRTAREVYSSDDYGQTWQSILRLSENDPGLNSVGFADELTGWVAGAKGSILRTTDGGKTWKKQDGGIKNDLGRIAVVDQHMVWILGDEIILNTNNGGDTWTQQRVPVDYYAR